VDKLLASQEVLCFMELVGFGFVCECHCLFMWGIAWILELCKVWGVNGGVTKDSVRILILHCVTGQIVPMFQKIIMPLKHCELCAQ
jgi:hypothetical protein